MLWRPLFTEQGCQIVRQNEAAGKYILDSLLYFDALPFETLVACH